MRRAETPDGPVGYVGFSTVEDRWSEYQLDNGVTVKIKVVVKKIGLLLDDDGELRVAPNGDPLVTVTSQTVVDAVPASYCQKRTFTEPIPEVRLREGLTLRPRAPETRKFSVIVKNDCYLAYYVPAMDVPLAAHSVKSLKSAVHDALAGLWEEYAEAPDETLWPDAQALKRRLLECYEVAAE